MLIFKKPELEDREWIQKIHIASGYRGAEYTFANLFLWSSFYGKVAHYRGFLCQRLNYQGVHQYIFPAGVGDCSDVLERLWEDSRSCGERFTVRSLTKETMALLQCIYPGRFTYEPDRDAYDYLYEIETLTELKGKKYQAKRNHINRFLEAYPGWYTEPVHGGNLDVCRQLADSGVRVIVAGLDMDYMGKPFGPMPALMATAEHVSKVHAICVRCGNLAHHSHRLTSDSKQVLLGAHDSYEPICRHCFNELTRGK